MIPYLNRILGALLVLAVGGIIVQSVRLDNDATNSQHKQSTGLVAGAAENGARVLVGLSGCRNFCVSGNAILPQNMDSCAVKFFHLASCASK